MASARGHCATREDARARRTRLNTSDCISTLIHEEKKKNLPLRGELFSFVRILASHFIIIPEALEIAFLRLEKRREVLYSVTTASFLPFFFVRSQGGWLDGGFFFSFHLNEECPLFTSPPSFSDVRSADAFC